jgi:hypothetical protein
MTIWLHPDIARGGAGCPAARAAALTDAQGVAETLLDAEVKLGEMLAAIKRKYESVGSLEGTDTEWDGPKQQVKTLPPTITKRESHQAQTIAQQKDTTPPLLPRYLAPVLEIILGAKEKGPAF